VAAYNFLRDRESQRLYGWKFTEVNNAIEEGNFRGNEESVKDRMEVIQKMYPLKLSEAEPKKSGF